MDDRELLRRLHDWFLEAAPEHYAGCGLYFDVNESLAAAPEPLRVAEPVSDPYKLAGEEVERLLALAASHDETALRFDRYHREEENLHKGSVWSKRAAEERLIASDLRSVLALIEPSAGGGEA